MDIASVDLNLLVVFDALLSEGSVTSAAKRVGLSQPAFSNALARLRSSVGDVLFERTGGRMAPTPHAQAMAAPVRAALTNVRLALAVASESCQPPPIVTVAVAANEYARCLIVPRAIATLKRRGPSVRLDIRSAPGPETSGADLTIDWAPPGRRPSEAVLLRDSLVGIVAHGRRRTDRSYVGSDGGHLLPDWFSTICLVSLTDVVAEVPYRLAKRFATPMGLSIFSLPSAHSDLCLEMACNKKSARSEPVAVVKDAIIAAARRLSGKQAA